jgi:hypothetical protein
VELESERRLERLDVLLQLTRDVHDAFEQFAIGAVGEVDVNVDTKVGFDMQRPRSTVDSRREALGCGSAGILS